jgi:hypothetical protein
MCAVFMCVAMTVWGLESRLIFVTTGLHACKYAEIYMRIIHTDYACRSYTNACMHTYIHTHMQNLACRANTEYRGPSAAGSCARAYGPGSEACASTGPDAVVGAIHVTRVSCAQVHICRCTVTVMVTVTDMVTATVTVIVTVSLL